MKRILLLLAACGTSELPDPLPLDVEVTPVGSATVSIDALRLTVGFRTSDALVFTNDVAVTATGTPIVLTLASPPIERPIPSSSLLLRQSPGFSVPSSLSVQIPSFVAYLDLDGSGTLQPEIDRVMGLGSTANTVAWVIALDAQLGRLQPERIAEYYRATGDRYTAFIHGEMLAANAYVASPAQPIIVDISQSANAAAALLCGPVDVEDRAPDVHLSIDDALQLGPLCAIGVGTCVSVDVATLDPIAPRADELTQCSRRGGLEAFVRERRRVKCDLEACRCFQERTLDAVITSTGATPAWWPCGDRIEYYEPRGPIYLIDPDC